MHPYLLLNYHGKTRDVMTLAHELGHGVHQVLAGAQGCLMSHTPLTLAETASVFGEMLTFRALLDAASPAQKRIMLASKVEDMLNTVVRQIAFYQFEIRVHDERRSGEILPERLGEIWMQIQAESLGPAFEFTPEYSVFWSYIPHFVHSPFYVYACMRCSRMGIPGSRRSIWICCVPGARNGTRNYWLRSGWMRPTRRSGPRGWMWCRALSMSWRRWADGRKQQSIR